jgi:hypothetical protein
VISFITNITGKQHSGGRVAGFGPTSFSHRFGETTPTCDKSFSALLRTKPDGIYYLIFGMVKTFGHFIVGVIFHLA